jgi:hypothetical protein
VARAATRQGCSSRICGQRTGGRPRSGLPCANPSAADLVANTVVEADFVTFRDRLEVSDSVLPKQLAALAAEGT